MKRDHYADNAATAAMLMEAGIALMRENLRRRHPGAPEAQLDVLLEAWMSRQDDPSPGDVAGPTVVRRRAL
jgi:hypothetical protein